MMQIRLLMGLGLATMMSCTSNKELESSLVELYPKLTVSTESVDFQTVVLYEEDQEFQIINTGLAKLNISDITISNNDDGIFSIAPNSGVIAPKESFPVLVHFDPATYREYNREIIIVSDDQDNPEFRLPLNGEGIDGPIPDIEMTPLVLDFGEVAQGSTAMQYFTLTNRGTGDLLIEEMRLEGSANFQVQTPVSGVIYGLEQSSDIVVSYSPTEEGGENAVLTIVSNDPDEGEQQVVLLGNGGGDFEYPIARFSCPSEVDPPTTVHLNGGNSSDPNGHEPLTYQWSLIEQPSSSITQIDEPTLEYTPLFVDASGDYAVQLVVTNTLGLASEPATCEFTGIPDESIQVELIWDKGNTDVDLHMVMEGYEPYTFEGDCCWCNPNPGWGDNGPADDPSLSLDNRQGFGPETIEIESPYDGSYNVMVHYFNSYGNGATTATVKVYLDGQLIAEESRLLSPLDLWDVGYIYWANGNGQFVVENSSPTNFSSGTCQ